MRILFTSTAGAGHLGPLLPFATALRSAGHEILVAAPISAQARVERAGLPFMSHADPPASELGPLWARVRAAGAEQANELVVGEVFAGARARAVPHARVGIGLAATEALALGWAAAGVDELRRWAGLAPDPGTERLAAAPYLTLTPPSLEAGAAP